MDRISSIEDPIAPAEHAARGLSLEGMHGTVAVPGRKAGFWRQWRAFAGPALLVSVGYMDPGNWGTDLQAGAQFKYRLLWVVAMASLMAIALQVISSAARGRYRHGPGPMLPRLVSALDANSQLARLRAGDRRMRPCRSARQRHRAHSAV